MSISVTLSHDRQILEILRDEWIDLQTRSSATGMSLTWQWIYIWYKHFNGFGELWLMTARHDNRLIGIAPLMKVEVQPDWGFAWQQIEFIGGSYHHEYLDFIIEPGYEEQLIPLFIDKLHEHKARWDVISLSAMSNTKTPHILQQSSYDWIEDTNKHITTVYMTLPATTDDWMQSISRNHRQKLRRYRNLLDKQFPDRWSISQINQPDELNDTFEHLVHLHQTRWEAQGEPGVFSGEAEIDYYRELLHCMLENNWLRLYRLDINDEPCAIYFCYHYNGRAYYELGGVNRDIVDFPLGYILMHHSIDRAIGEALHEYSFMLGEQSYKYSFGGVNRVHQAFRLISNPRVRSQIRIVGFLRQVKHQLRRTRSQILDTASDTPAHVVDEN